MTIIDLRSDTITRPSEGMRKAMAQAEVGDDVYGEDPAVNELQALATRITGKQKALFVPSGSMGNLIALYLQAGRGKEVLTQKNSHVIHYELSSAATLAGVTCVPVEGERGILTPKALTAHLRNPELYYMPRVGLIEVENSHNHEGGTCYTPEELDNLGKFAQKMGFPIHMDGARIFNASLAVKTPVETLCAIADTLTFCLSKGLGAPVGSLLCGDAPFIDEARRVRKLLGGGMRQAGILAAAGLWALKNNVERLWEDHENAKALARALKEAPWAAIDPSRVETNILYFDTPGHNAAAVVATLEGRGILSSAFGPGRIRMVTSLAVTAEQTKEACRIIGELDI